MHLSPKTISQVRLRLFSFIVRQKSWITLQVSLWNSERAETFSLKIGLHLWTIQCEVSS